MQHFLPDYEAQLGWADLGPLTPLNVDLSTITAATDIALGHGDPPDRILDVNFQSGPDAELPARVLLYHALLHYRFGVPVHSVVVLLRPAADLRQLTGQLRYVGRPRKGKMAFTYEVQRLWRLPVRRVPRGGLGTLPLAPLCQLPEGALPETALTQVIRQLAERLEREAPPEERAKLLAAAYVLTGLRVTPGVAERLFQGVRGMKDSSTYQAILAEGREEGRAEGRVEALQKMLLRLGRQRCGPPSESVQAATRAVTDESRLERMIDRVLTASSWQEFLDAP